MRRISPLSLAGILVLGAMVLSDTLAASAPPHPLTLNSANNGQHVAAAVGEQIEITLPRGDFPPNHLHYETPEVSSPAIRLEEVAVGELPNPGFGGGSEIYIFEADREGEAKITFPACCSNDPDLIKRSTFVVAIHVGPSAGIPYFVYASQMPDQVNAAPGTKPGWVNFINKLQTFRPSLPRLTAVEVELAVMNPGPSEEKVGLSVSHPRGEFVASVSKTVKANECRHVLFILPHGGVQVTPGEVYIITVGDGNLFGWKYVVGGYAQGAAMVWDTSPDPPSPWKPLSPQSRCTFLFRTFGAN